MRYRIKITTHDNGRKGYVSQKKTKIGWINIDYNGCLEFIPIGIETSSREFALERIDRNYEGNTKKVLIEFEYIDKPKIS